MVFCPGVAFTSSWGGQLSTVLFVSKAADPWVVVDGLLSWCRFHFQLGWTTFHNWEVVHYSWK
jgi:hypothetical protein